MNALKALVIGMGLLIVVGLGLLGYGVYRNSQHLAAGKPTPPAKSVAAELPSRGASGGPSPAYYTVDLPIPAGTRLDQMAAAGNRVILRFTGVDGDRILVVDPQNGQVAGTISLVPQKP